MKKLEKFWSALMKLTERVVVFQLGALCLVLLYQVISRYVFNKPLIWSEEMALYLLTWVTFIGLPYAIHRRAHVRMTSLEVFLPRNARKWTLTLMDVVFGVACAAAFMPSVEYFMTMTGSHSPGMRLNYGFVYVCMPAGFTLTILSLVVDIGRLWTGDIPGDI
ncbi:MAG: TRAP transporter small permease [Synergistaceae bacterium]|jgi:TRAP-type C4-dicarboxylate transport system permease small subunit|nr:TRAP transporter small permease [Synergistaceae bacterium]